MPNMITPFNVETSVCFLIDPGPQALAIKTLEFKGHPSNATYPQEIRPDFIRPY